jgi:hypothetical protein
MRIKKNKYKIDFNFMLIFSEPATLDPEASELVMPIPEIGANVKFAGSKFSIQKPIVS